MLDGKIKNKFDFSNIDDETFSEIYTYLKRSNMETILCEAFAELICWFSGIFESFSRFTNNSLISEAVSGWIANSIAAVWDMFSNWTGLIGLFKSIVRIRTTT